MKRGVVYKRLKMACISSKERLYLQNSKDIVQLIQEFGLLPRYPWLKEMLPQDSITQLALTSLKNRFKSRAEESAERAREAERALRQQRVRQIIDEYAENN